MKTTRFEAMQEKSAEGFPKEQGDRIKSTMKKEYDRLIEENKDIPESFISHTRNNIFPVAAAFKAFLNEGMDRDEAAKKANDCFLSLMEDIAVSIRKMMKIPGMYHLMPFMWKTAMPKLFREDSGFGFSFYPTGKDEVKFDMTNCPYYNICKKLDLLEIAPTFCSSDDICYGNMHPRLIWNRTKTIARGGDCCDFDLYVKK